MGTTNDRPFSKSTKWRIDIIGTIIDNRAVYRPKTDCRAYLGTRRIINNFIAMRVGYTLSGLVRPIPIFPRRDCTIICDLNAFNFSIQVLK